jgi:hypothetical protein
MAYRLFSFGDISKINEKTGLYGKRKRQTDMTETKFSKNMCKHILRVQFILIDGFQDDLSKKKNFPHIPVHAARPGRTDMLSLFQHG